MLTGNTRYRIGWRKKLVLQVEVGNPMPWPNGFHYPGFAGWRDATERDLFEIEKLRRHYDDGTPYVPQAGYDASTGQTRGHVPPRQMPQPKPVQ